MMKTLYEDDPTFWDILAAQGKPSLREMAKLFTSTQDLDTALGYHRGGAARHWHQGNNGASNESERRAAKWLGEQSSPTKQPDEVAQFFCVCDAATAVKARKVLTRLGVEFDDL